MTAGRPPILVFRSARPGRSFETWLFSKLSPATRRSVAAGIGVLLPLWREGLGDTRLVKQHGPGVSELRSRFTVPGARPCGSRRTGRPQGAPSTLRVFFTDDRGVITLLSGAISGAGKPDVCLGIPGLGDARWRLRELRAAREDRSVTVDTLALDVFEDIKDQCFRTAAPWQRAGPARSGTPGLVDFERLVDFVRNEAECAGDDAVRQLGQAEDRFRLASATLLGRRARGITQRRLASLTGIQQRDISCIESAGANPTLATIGALALALGVELRVGAASE